MNILVIGSGGREHALLWALSHSKGVSKLYAAPGNGGTSQLAENVDLTLTDHQAVIDFCKQHRIGLVVIGPEGPLVDGLADSLEYAGILTFGPSKAAARLEGSKAFTKHMCDKYHIPTAAYAEFTNATKAKAYVKTQKLPIVIKADGLAGGKGVTIAHHLNEAFTAIDHALVDGVFGDAGQKIVIEEFLVGEEVSFFVLVDEITAIPFGSAQDHKTVGEGDTGPNTGGMGTYSPAPIMTPALHDTVMETIILPLVQGMNDEGCPFKGVLFAGLMVTNDGPKLLEINVRFGDPETQCLMARLGSDLLPLLLAASKGDLTGHQVTLKDTTALCVVMASKGYPGDYKRGTVIGNLGQAEASKNVVIFHAGTAEHNGKLLATGGRVLGITATAPTVTGAQHYAYHAIRHIHWPEGFCRQDIGWRAVAREKLLKK